MSLSDIKEYCCTGKKVSTITFSTNECSHVGIQAKARTIQVPKRMVFLALLHLIGILAEIFPQLQLLMVAIGERALFDWGWTVIAEHDGHIILQCVLLGLVIAGVCFMLYSLAVSCYCLIDCRYCQRDIDREERRQYQDALWELEQNREKLRRKTTEVNRTAVRGKVN